MTDHKLYKQGDPDPTESDDIIGDCPAVSSGPWTFYCTWDRGHDHPQHVAGTGNHIAHVWPA